MRAQSHHNTVLMCSRCLKNTMENGVEVGRGISRSQKRTRLAFAFRFQFAAQFQLSLPQPSMTSLADSSRDAGANFA